MHKLKTLIRGRINEYSEKVMNQMVSLYKPQTQDSEEQIKGNINRFQQLSGAIAKKLTDGNPLMLRAVPAELLSSNKFRDITLYKDYETLLRVLKASDTKSTDIYKQAIEFYKKQNQYELPATIGNYVARFKMNLTALEDKVNDKDPEVARVIPKELLQKDAYKNILNWRNFQQLEHMLDALFPIIIAKDANDMNSAETDADKIYEDKNTGIEVYKGDEEHKCIKYSKGYSWCIGRTMYSNYRYMQSGNNNRMFYFVFDKTQPETNQYHVVVIHVTEQGKFLRTTSKNNGDEPYQGAKTWSEFSKAFEGTDGQRLWNKIKSLEKLFKFINPNKDELRRLGFKGKKLTLDAFLDFDVEDKRDWLRANASDRNIVNTEIINSLPPFGEPSKNDLINYDRVFSFNELKSNTGLLKRYPDYRFTRHQKDPLPYEFIPYLKENLQRKYFDEFEADYLTFDEIEKYFSKNILDEYIEKQISKYGFLPEEAIKYMTPDQKKIFDIYNIAYKDVNYFNGGDLSDSAIIAPQRMAMVHDLSYKTFTSLNNDERKKFMGFFRNIGGDIKNLEKYNTPEEGGFFTGIPLAFSFKKSGKIYFITPLEKPPSENDKNDKNNSDKFVITDEDGNMITPKPFANITLYKNGKELDQNSLLGKPTGTKTYWVEEGEYDSIKGDGKDIPLNILKEITASETSNRLKYLAGIIK